MYMYDCVYYIHVRVLYIGIEEEVEVQETVAQSKRSPFSDRKRRRERRDRRTIMPPVSGDKYYGAK